ncbi:MAG: SMP-30/gluconolactonase/LRE family protein [Balneolaceae bacterium]
MNDKWERKEFIKRVGGGLVMSVPMVSVLATLGGCNSNRSRNGDEELFVARNFTEPDSFTSGVEGPAVDADGNLYAVNYERQHTIGKVTPEGEASVFVELPDGSIANGIRFNSRGEMLLADYTNHNILKVDMQTREISVHAHQPEMNQPNDIAIDSNDRLYASDPNWDEGTGQLWRIDPDGSTTLLEKEMGTTNGVEVNPDENKLYVNETRQRKVWVYDLSPEGEVSNKRLLIEFSPEYGMDGMRCDREGNLYITRHGKGTVAVISPDGELIREINLAEGQNTTNLAFGGPDGCTIYVTMADVGNIQVFRSDIPGRSWQMLQG